MAKKPPPPPAPPKKAAKRHVVLPFAPRGLRGGAGGGRKSTTWPKGGHRPPGIKSGRPKGSKNKVPASLKQSIVQICQDLVATDPGLIRRAFKKGLQARPPASYAYLQLAAAYLDGRPTERIQVEGKLELQVSQAGQTLKVKLQQMADALVAARARAQMEAERRELPWAAETVLDAVATPLDGQGGIPP